MKATKYHLTFTKVKTKLLVVYSNGQFKKLEYVSGGVGDKFWRSLMHAIPFDEHLIPEVVKSFENRIIYTKIDDNHKESQYKNAMGAYFRFFRDQTNLDPKIDKSEGAALKKILAYLNKQTATEPESYVLWLELLNNWDKLDDFYRNQRTLKQINSNLTTVLTLIKQPLKGKHPNKWDADYAKKLDPKQTSEYWAHLRSLGLKAKKDQMGRVVEWI